MYLYNVNLHVQVVRTLALQKKHQQYYTVKLHKEYLCMYSNSCRRFRIHFPFPVSTGTCTVYMCCN